MASVFDSYAPIKGDLSRRSSGSLIAFETGESVTYGLWAAQERGALFIGPGVPVYGGMVVGKTPKSEDITVNVCRKEAADQHAGLGLRRGPPPGAAPRIFSWSSAWSFWPMTSCWRSPRKTSAFASGFSTTKYEGPEGEQKYQNL